MQNFVTIAELNNAVIHSLSKIPHDVDLIVGIPRSGMLVASIIAAQLNKPLTDIEGYINNGEYSVGLTTNISVKPSKEIKKVLVVEDSVLLGTSITAIKKRISDSGLNVFREHVYYAAYISEIYNAEKHIDIFAEKLDNRIFEWNLMHHYLLKNMCFDIDGVLCEDPTNEENDDGEQYISFLKNARPKFVPTKRIGYLVTSRLEKYRKETEYWLNKYGIEYDHLLMSQYATAEERRRKGTHAVDKALVYRHLPDTILFVESDQWQAQDIARRTLKPVFCTGNQHYYTAQEFPRENRTRSLYNKIKQGVPESVKKLIKILFNKLFSKDYCA